MTKDELKAKVAKQQSIINDANNQICSDVKEYIESLPYKVDEKYIPVKVINELKASFCRAVEITIVKN